MPSKQERLWTTKADIGNSATYKNNNIHIIGDSDDEEREKVGLAQPLETTNPNHLIQRG